MGQYAFGDSDLAAQRLRRLAENFAVSSRPFIGRAAGGPRTVVDLGCGPGFTTRMLSELLPGSRVVGLDNSERFIRLAEAGAIPRATFHVHDVTAVPFPVAPADLLYCRFLFTHLRDVRGTLVKWATQVVRGGRLLVEEVEAIETTNATFQQYLDIVAGMLAAQGNALYVGPVLGGLGPVSGLDLVESSVCKLPVARHAAAAMFAMNIRTWRDNAFVREHYPQQMIDSLRARLEELAALGDEQSDIGWQLRQIVYACKLR